MMMMISSVRIFKYKMITDVNKCYNDYNVKCFIKTVNYTAYVMKC